MFIRKMFKLNIVRYEALILVGLCLALCVRTGLAQTTFYVVAVGGSDDPGQAGTNWASAFATISNAVARASDLDTILVATGRYNVGVSIAVARNLTIRGWDEHAGAEDRVNTIMDGQSNCAPLYINNSNAIVSGFTITGGNGLGGVGSTRGGGVSMNGGMLSNCIVENNSVSRQGGGVYLTSNAVIANCVVQNNFTTESASGYGGGGLYVVSASVLNSRLLGNTSAFCGGGIYAIGDLTVADCLIANNQAPSSANGSGGGVYILGTNVSINVSIVGAVISNNISGVSGGGVSVYVNGSLVLQNSVITHNNTRVAGGGMHCYRTAMGGGMLISNCNISYNSVTGGAYYGGGIMDGYFTGATSTGLLSVVNSKIFSNNASYGCGVFIYTHGTALFHNCEIINNREDAGVGVFYIGTGSASVVVRNCLVAGNLNRDGAGIFLGAQGSANSGPNPLDLRIQSCTIANNTATRDYGGLQVLNGATVWNTVVASNRADRFYPDLRGDAAYIAPVRYSCSPLLVNAAQGNITGYPVFVDCAGTNYRLQVSSLCVNTGTNQPDWMPTASDLDGRVRLDRFSRKVDMGAYEYVPQGFLFTTR